MNVVMIGAGYVGLVSGACFAEFGADVICVDKDEGKINALLATKISFINKLSQLCAKTGADAIVLMTEWNQYRGLDLAKIRSLIRGKVFVDLRNVYEPNLVEKHGFEYTCIGR